MNKRIKFTYCYSRKQPFAKVEEWVIVELQGDLETKTQNIGLGGKFIGDLHFTHKVSCFRCVILTECGFEIYIYNTEQDNTSYYFTNFNIN